MKILSKVVVLGLIGISSVAHAGMLDEKAERNSDDTAPTASSGNGLRKRPEHPLEMIGPFKAIASFLDAKSLNALRGVSLQCYDFADSGKNTIKTAQYRALPNNPEFFNQFVQIPEGILPADEQRLLPIWVEAHEASQYPVTQKLWEEVMGRLPAGVQLNQPNCPDCPVTWAHWEKESFQDHDESVKTFLARLNERTRHLGCTYDLPTDAQLQYEIRGDKDGDNQDPFSKGVTLANVDEYVTYSGNSNGSIQPIRKKKLNNFGIELGNVLKMTKDLRNPTRPWEGKGCRGVSWSNNVYYARSKVRPTYECGSLDSLGFTLVRTCSK